MRHAAIDFVVRTVRRSDIPRCVVVDRLTHSDPWTERDFASSRRDQDTMILVAVLPAQFEWGEELIGCCVASHDADEDKMTFSRLAVHPEWQRCGVGSALFTLCQRTLPTASCEALVPRDSQPHIQFWGGIGFSRVSERECPPILDVYRR